MVLPNLIDSFQPTFYGLLSVFLLEILFFTWFLGHYILTSLPIFLQILWWILLIFLTLNWSTPELSLQIFLPSLSQHQYTDDPSLYSQASLHLWIPVFQIQLPTWHLHLDGFPNITWPQKSNPWFFTPHDSCLSPSLLSQWQLHFFLITQVKPWNYPWLLSFSQSLPLTHQI